VCFQSSFESAQGARIVDGSRYIVPGSQCRDNKEKLVEVRRGMRPVQGCSGTRVQCPWWLVSVQLALKVSLYTRVDGSERNCPELEGDMLADRQPVQLPPQLSGTRTMWCLSDHTGERVLDMLKAVEVALGSAVEQAITVVETRTNNTHCNRLSSIECQSWTDVAQSMNMKVAGNDDAGYMPVHGKCKVEHNAKKLDSVRELEAGASHLNNSGSIHTSESGLYMYGPTENSTPPMANHWRTHKTCWVIKCTH